ncbi:phospholipase D-like domain-containing protein [Actinomadura rupiterrae]|uniref:phospholipase D-like domain-containing protein n=1 Tax=Actinomadura rupiterrae TaxID=559627 RepID=UPI0020A43562|nr:phospholipase D-like domain-containing protein [Actinomadura rupiterrae]MCP2343536.1 phosphatidylserine/phosphatidylglycerophosphate/cardiolipin synthase-like enzyme [Actinomadura rupiterrae]
MADTMARTSFSATNLTVYFQSARAGLESDLGARLAEFVAAARTSLDVAIYDLRDDGVLRALKSAADRGVALRLLYDAGPAQHGGPVADPKPGTTGRVIADAGLAPFATPYPERHGQLMHNKFIVRDHTALWTGSANFTGGGLRLQDNNCLVFDDPGLAASYSAEFEALLTAAGPPAGLKADVAATVGTIGVEPLFAPEAGEGIEDAIVGALSGAQRVRIAAFLISDAGILQALKALHDAGADLGGVYDPGGMADARRGSHQDPALWWFLKDPNFAAAPSHPFTPGAEQDFMHNKLLVIDGRTVVTGSYNFSEHAETNAENALVLTDPELAAAYESYIGTMLHTYRH